MTNEVKTNGVGEKPIYKKWWFGVIIAVVLSAIIGVSINQIRNTDDTSGKIYDHAETKNTSKQTVTHLYDNAKVKYIYSPPETINGEYVDDCDDEGKYSIIRTDSTKVTDESLADWYFNYVTNEDNEFEWCMILFTDKSDHSGVFAIKGQVKKNVIFEQDRYENYRLRKSPNSTVYYVPTDEGTLISSAMFVEQVRVAIRDTISSKDESIIDVVFQNGDLCVYVEFTRKDSSPQTLQDLAYSRTTSITEAILELEKYNIFWETITVDFGETGHITNPKENVAMDEFGRSFLVVMSDLE